MVTNTRTVNTTPDQVWNVLADGWLYPLWVVGATRIRDVEQDWPAVGSKIHHSVGVWPAVLDDDTEVLGCEPGRSMRLRARGWPLGEAEVQIRLSAQGSGTLVEISEEVVAGPGKLLPEPLRGMTIKVRNVETLNRLALVSEGRTPH
jgi:uncharacterized protein YndB with AHSA1/START domain